MHENHSIPAEYPPHGKKPQSEHIGRFALLAGFCFALIALCTRVASASGWRSVDETGDGIHIFQKGTGEEGLIAFRGNGLIDAPAPLVATVISDTLRRREWIEGLADSRIIRWHDRSSFIEYDHIEMPIFFRDRDFVSHVSIGYDPARKEITFHYRPSKDASAPRTRYIRGELLNMTFVLSAVDNGNKTMVDAEFLCDPKGWIPSWLVNFFLRDWPKATFRNLRKEVLKSDLTIDPRFTTLPRHRIIGAKQERDRTLSQ